MITLEGRPISKKRNYRRSANGRMYLSVTWVRWSQRALWQLKKYKERYTGPVHIEYTFEMKGKLDADIDNLQAGINDILQEAGIIDDDKNIMSVSARKYRGFKDWRTMVNIKPLTADHKNRTINKQKFIKTYKGDLTIDKDNRNDFTDLEKVTGDLSIGSQVKLPNLKSVGGYLHIYSKAKLSAPNLKSVGGYLSIGFQAELSAPNLKSVGGYLSIGSQTKLPNLKSIDWWWSLHQLPN